MLLLSKGTFYVDFLEVTFISTLTLGEEAGAFNTIEDDVTCFNFTQNEDAIKEGLEVLMLTLNSTDPAVCPGRDLSLIRIPPNGSKSHTICIHVQSTVWFRLASSSRKYVELCLKP